MRASRWHRLKLAIQYDERNQELKPTNTYKHGGSVEKVK